MSKIIKLISSSLLGFWLEEEKGRRNFGNEENGVHWPNPSSLFIHKTQALIRNICVCVCRPFQDHKNPNFVQNKTLGFPSLMAGHTSSHLGRILLDQVSPNQETNLPLLAN